MALKLEIKPQLSVDTSNFETSFPESIFILLSLKIQNISLCRFSSEPGNCIDLSGYQLYSKNLFCVCVCVCLCVFSV